MQPFASLVSPYRAHSSTDCNDQFLIFFPRVISSLPVSTQSLFRNLKTSDRIRFEKRFQHRDKIRAHAEAARIYSRILLRPTYLNADFLFKPEPVRYQLITEALQGRLEQEANRARLENTLLDLGYKPDSDRQQGLSRFQAAHFRELESLKRFAVNSAATAFMGLPILMGRFQYQRFNLKTPTSKDPAIRAMLENEILTQQERITSRDPALIKEIKRELAIEMARRILVIGVFAILTNELLEFLFPTWKEIQSEFWNSTSSSDRESLEETAMQNWLELHEAFSGEKIAAESPLYLEMRARIKNAATETLKAHVNQGAPLPDKSD